ncbi:MAG: type III-B CRISPR module RAMP protein Cmr6 [Candidatus Hydrothermales bacterium]
MAEIRGMIWFGNSVIRKEIIVKSENIRKAEQSFFEKLKEEIGKSKIENFNLFINKYVPIIDAEIKSNGKKQFFSLKTQSIGGESKKHFYEGLLEKFTFSIPLNFQNTINSQKESLRKQGFNVIFSDSLKTYTRLIIGLGSAHVLETSITLHHIYGIPYIPASAIKGVCRMAAYFKIAKNKNILENESKLENLQKEFYGELSFDEDILKYQLLFGAMNFKGLLLFLDAYPEIRNNHEAFNLFDLDIMNVHYQKYYGDEKGKILPGDWEYPNPITFLTLKKGIRFNFIILFDEFRAKKLLEMEDEKFKNLKIPQNAKELINSFKENDFRDLKEEVKDLLEDALKNLGVGAKTRLGYGILE